MEQINRGYLGNPLLKKPNTQMKWSPVLIKEYAKCKASPVYFIQNYMKIVNVDEGLVRFKLRKYQMRMLKSMVEEKNTVIATARQAGKTTTFCGFVLHYIIFNPNKTVGVLANKGDTARDILQRIQSAYEHLPKWLQQGVREFNKGKFELENGSRVLAAASSSAAIRGWSINCLILDEAAFVENWDEFFSSVFPTISSGTSTKMIMVSTPNGLNHFHKIWQGAQYPRDDKDWNGFNPIKVLWHQVPGRDAKWKNEQIAILGEEKFRQENEVEFQGSSGTLIDGWKLKELVHQRPMIAGTGNVIGLKIYEKYTEGRKYAMCCDVAHGKGFDYSAFQIIDITEFPYRQAVAFKNNTISPIDYAALIHRVNMNYKFCPILVENNDIGSAVIHMLLNDHQAENIISTQNAGRVGKRVSTGFSGKAYDMGIRTTSASKHIGCQILKVLIEQNQLIINDFDTIFELSRFSKKNNSYEAEEGSNDDLVMALVLFAWLTTQEYFKAISNQDTIGHLRKINAEETEEELIPFGFINDGVNDFDDGNFDQGF